MKFFNSLLKSKYLGTFLSIFLLVLTLSSFLIPNNNLISSEAKAEETAQVLDQMTNQIVDLNNSNKEQNKEEIKDLSEKRKDLLTKVAENNPSEFLDQAKLTDKKPELSPEVQTNIEEKVETEGTLLEVHIDKPNKESKTDYVLQAPDKLYKLNFTKGADIKSGSQVKVKAVGIDSNLVVASPGDNTANTSIQTLSAPTTPTPQDEKTAVLLINFSNNTSQPVSPSTVDLVMFNNSNSVNAYYRENSFNQVNINGTVFNWLTIPSTDEYCEGNWYNWGTEANTAATQAGVDLSQYKHIIYTFTTPANCSYGGLGTIGGQPGLAWIFNYYGDNRVYSHELGHNLGVQHANSLTCGSQAIDIATNCTENEYGDNFDPMGFFWNVGSNLLHFNAPHKIALNWIPASNVQTVASSGDYTINNLENQTSSTQALKINKPDTGESYYVSFRKASGFDYGLIPNYKNGSSVHIWNGDPARQTKLIDTTPGTGDFSGFGDATLLDGQSFTDPINNVKITQKSHTIDSSLVNIIFLNQPDLIVTDFNWTPANPSANSSVTFNVTIKNQGTIPTPNGVIHGVGFYIDGAASAKTWTNSYTQSIPAGGSVNLTTNGPAWIATAGSHTVVAKVDDVNRIAETNDNNNQLSKTLSVSVSPSPTPNITPTPSATATPKPSTTPTTSPTVTPTATPTSTPNPTVTPTPTPNNQPIVLQAESGAIKNPFQVFGTYIAQTIQTAGSNFLSTSGEAKYTFTITQSGTYYIKGLVSAVNGSSNSFFINIDAQPSIDMIWEFPLSSTFKEYTVSLRGTTGPKAYNLTSGTHTLIVRGREANAKLDSIKIIQQP